jgi:hypothetical protein
MKYAYSKNDNKQRERKINIINNSKKIRIITTTDTKWNLKILFNIQQQIKA